MGHASNMNRRLNVKTHIFDNALNRERRTLLRIFRRIDLFPLHPWVELMFRGNRDGNVAHIGLDAWLCPNLIALYNINLIQNLVVNRNGDIFGIAHLCRMRETRDNTRLIPVNRRGIPADRTALIALEPAVLKFNLHTRLRGKSLCSVEAALYVHGIKLELWVSNNMHSNRNGLVIICHMTNHSHVRLRVLITVLPGNRNLIYRLAAFQGTRCELRQNKVSANRNSDVARHPHPPKRACAHQGLDPHRGLRNRAANFIGARNAIEELLREGIPHNGLNVHLITVGELEHIAVVLDLSRCPGVVAHLSQNIIF